MYIYICIIYIYKYLYYIYTHYKDSLWIDGIPSMSPSQGSQGNQGQSQGEEFPQLRNAMLVMLQHRLLHCEAPDESYAQARLNGWKGR